MSVGNMEERFRLQFILSYFLVPRRFRIFTSVWVDYNCCICVCHDHDHFSHHHTVSSEEVRTKRKVCGNVGVMSWAISKLSPYKGCDVGPQHVHFRERKDNADIYDQSATTEEDTDWDDAWSDDWDSLSGHSYVNTTNNCEGSDSATSLEHVYEDLGEIVLQPVYNNMIDSDCENLDESVADPDCVDNTCPESTFSTNDASDASVLLSEATTVKSLYENTTVISAEETMPKVVFSDELGQEHGMNAEAAAYDHLHLQNPPKWNLNPESRYSRVDSVRLQDTAAAVGQVMCTIYQKTASLSSVREGVQEPNDRSIGPGEEGPMGTTGTDSRANHASPYPAPKGNVGITQYHTTQLPWGGKEETSVMTHASTDEPPACVASEGCTGVTQYHTVLTPDGEEEETSVMIHAGANDGSGNAAPEGNVGFTQYHSTVTQWGSKEETSVVINVGVSDAPAYVAPQGNVDVTQYHTVETEQGAAEKTSIVFHMRDDETQMAAPEGQVSVTHYHVVQNPRGGHEETSLVIHPGNDQGSSEADVMAEGEVRVTNYIPLQPM